MHAELCSSRVSNVTMQCRCVAVIIKGGCMMKLANAEFVLMARHLKENSQQDGDSDETQILSTSGQGLTMADFMQSFSMKVVM